MTMKLGRCRLKSILKKRNMTQTELGRLMNLSPQRISDYCNDRFIMSLQVALNISMILNVHVEDLYDQVDGRQ